MDAHYAPLANAEVTSPEGELATASSNTQDDDVASSSSTLTNKTNSPEIQIAKLAKVAWDPLNCPEWDAYPPSSQCLQRIRRDLMSLYNDPPHGVFVVPDEDNLTRIHALVVGPYDTPYEGGFFYFVLRCPPDYPIKPPKVRLITTGNDTVRFNPNLYRNGKVCLSILGTWSGPAWSPAQSLCSVLVSIQSLLNENPYHNEPGFEKEHQSGDSCRYNQIIAHETVRVAVCDLLDKDHESALRNMPASLKEVVKNSFSQYYDHYICVCRQLESVQGTVMIDPFGEKRGVFNPVALIKRLAALKDLLNADTGDAEIAVDECTKGNTEDGNSDDSSNGRDF